MNGALKAAWALTAFVAIAGDRALAGHRQGRASPSSWSSAVLTARRRVVTGRSRPEGRPHPVMTDVLVDYDEVLTPLRAGDRPGDPRRARHRVEDVLRLLDRRSAPSPNTQTCPVCLGLPGALPVANAAAIECDDPDRAGAGLPIATWCRFARKNYFYPDMPKNFQTSQYDEPLCTDGLPRRRGGRRDLPGRDRAGAPRGGHRQEHARRGATGRIHGADYSLVDYNRAGIPLVEIVTRPVPGTGALAPEVARAYVTELRDILRSARRLRRAHGAGQPALRREHLARADRQPRVGHPHRDEERQLAALGRARGALRDAPPGRAARRRRADHAGDPALPRGHRQHLVRAGARRRRPTTGTSPSPTWCRWRPTRSGSSSSRPRCPSCRPPAARRLSEEWGLRRPRWRWLANAGAVDLVGDTVAAGASPAEARKWWLGELARRANDAGVELAELADHAGAGRRAGGAGRRRHDQRPARPAGPGRRARRRGRPGQVVEARGLAVVAESDELVAAVDAAIEANPDVAEKVRGGKVQAIGALVGAVMKATRGKADAATVKRMLEERLLGRERDLPAVELRPLRREDFPLLARWLASRWWPAGGHETPAGGGRARSSAPASTATSRPAMYLGEAQGGRWVSCRSTPSPTSRSTSRSWPAVCPVPPGALSIDYLIGEPWARGRGLGTRLIAAAVARGFADHPAARDVIVPVAAGNVASWRALQRAGAEWYAEGELTPDNPVDPRDHVVHRFGGPA